MQLYRKTDSLILTAIMLRGNVNKKLWHCLSVCEQMLLL